MTKCIAWLLLVSGVAVATVVVGHYASPVPIPPPPVGGLSVVRVTAETQEGVELARAAGADPRAFLAAVGRRRAREAAAMVGRSSVSVTFNNDADGLRVDAADAMMAKYGWEAAEEIVLRAAEGPRPVAVPVAE